MEDKLLRKLNTSLSTTKQLVNKLTARCTKETLRLQKYFVTESYRNSMNRVENIIRK
ncbi:hypothetical protein ACIQXZ_29520 [Bacillus thuringiensis]|uniref:hypothetical protein n=1 Tax=Bacillus thuringiensis TaxID=1428 RepID=UPI003823AC4E